MKVPVTALMFVFAAICTRAEPVWKSADLVDFPRQAEGLIDKCLLSKKLPERLVLHFRTRDLGKQMFVKLERKDVYLESLVFSVPQQKDEDRAFVSCIVYRNYEKRGTRGMLAFESTFRCDSKTLARLQELYVLRLLNAYVILDMPSVEKSAGTQGPSFEFKTDKMELVFTDSQDEILKVPCVLEPFESFPEAGNKSSNSTKPLEMEIQLEDLPDIKYFFDWEPEYGAWYAREFNWRATGRGVVVWQENATNTVWETKLPVKIPPGRYSILIMPVYIRHRLTQNMLDITLNGCKRRYAWFYSEGWKYGPVFETKKAGDSLIIEGVELGGAGLGCMPTYLQQKLIVLDKILITTDINRKEEPK